MYFRIFPSRTMKIGCHALAGLSTMWWIGNVFASAFQCQPVAKAWDKSIPGTCFNNAQFFLVVIWPNIAIDVLILCLPVWEVRRLHLPRKQRLALCGIFLLGAGVIVISGIRLYYHIQLDAKGTNGDITSKL